jgi:isoquinoline 1-oxidoreductase subunit beta
MEVEWINPKSAVPVLWWRSVGHSHSAYVMETMIDELATLARKDPVAYRLGLLQRDPRAPAVVELAKARSNWGQPLPKGQGRGFAYHHSFNTRVAIQRVAALF